MTIEKIECSPRTAAFLLMITAVLWSLGGILIKSIQWNSLAIAGGRSAIAALFILLLRRKLTIDWSFTMVGGGLAYAGTVTFFVAATRLTTAANAILIQYTAPIYVAIFSAWFLKEKIHRVDIISILVVLCGLTLFFMDKIETSAVHGNIFAIISGVCFGWVALFLRKQKNASPLDSVIVGNIITALFCIPFYFDTPLPDVKGWIALTALGVIQLGISYILFSIAIRHVRAVISLIIPMVEPILNPFWVFLFIGEIPGPWALIGGFVVLIAITVRGVLLARNKQSNIIVSQA